MRRKFAFLVLALCLVLSSCSNMTESRKVEIQIPNHPWEAASGKKLWYTLKWTDGDDTHSLYLSPESRIAKISIPIGETVLIAAYPLGDMAPFTAVVTPLDSTRSVKLFQSESRLVSALLEVDSAITQQLNYRRLMDEIEKKTDDVRNLDFVLLLRDLQNGELSESSIRKVNCFAVDSFAIANGLWVSENLKDPSLMVTDNMTGDMQLPEGVYRYLNSEMDRVLTIVVDSRGEVFSYMKQSLL